MKMPPRFLKSLNKLLKSDEDNTTGDVQILCQLFSGESSSYRFATERAREIPANIPFSILGSTQVPYAARLLCRMDQGHGLLDRFMFLFPMCLRPTTTGTEEAHTWFESEEVSLKQISDMIFLEMHGTHDTPISSHYTFSEDAQQQLTAHKDDFIQEVNDAIREGNVPPKSTKVDLLPRVSSALHVFNFIAEELIAGRKPGSPSTEISLETLNRAQCFIDYAETQKEIAMEVSNDFTQLLVQVFFGLVAY